MSEDKIEIKLTALNQDTIKVPIEGKTPLLMDRMSEEVKKGILDKQIGMAKGNKKKVRDLKEETKVAIHRTSKGKIGFPATGFKKGMMEVTSFVGDKFFSRKLNCILWLWTTHSQIWSAKEIMKGWGFDYKCILVWNKEAMGIGKWLRKQCEFCLLGIKGKPVWTATNVRDILSEKRTTHSTKPESFYKMVDEICVGRKLDYFARKKRKGWDAYGDEIAKKRREDGI